MYQRRMVLAFLLLLAVTPALEAVITALTPLSDIVVRSPYIVSAKVEKVDADKLTAVFTVEEDLKGKFPVRRLPTDLTGDSEAKKDKHTEKLLKRIAPNVPLVFFVVESGNDYVVFGYTNGTWFQMSAQKGADPAKAVFAFNHCEPYLTRTFRGTTEEMKKLVVDAIAKKGKLPAPNTKEPPGFGPELPPAEKAKGQEEARALLTIGRPVLASRP
jgi:hypothetical protein